MAKFDVKDTELDGYVDKLLMLRDKSPIGKAVYEGAKIVADQIKANIKTIPISYARGTPEKPVNGITPYQRKGLIDGFGISHMKNESGYINVKTGFNGYNKTVSKTAKNAKWSSKQQANAMIARSVEKGTSFRKKHPFVAPAVSKTRTAAETAMKKKFDELLIQEGFKQE